jgi:hypothetical protein
VPEQNYDYGDLDINNLDGFTDNYEYGDEESPNSVSSAVPAAGPPV